MTLGVADLPRSLDVRNQGAENIAVPDFNRCSLDAEPRSYRKFLYAAVPFIGRQHG
jgi:hypothetical protein